MQDLFGYKGFAQNRPFVFANWPSDPDILAALLYSWGSRLHGVNGDTLVWCEGNNLVRIIPEVPSPVVPFARIDPRSYLDYTEADQREEHVSVRQDLFGQLPPEPLVTTGEAVLVSAASPGLLAAHTNRVWLTIMLLRQLAGREYWKNITVAYLDNT